MVGSVIGSVAGPLIGGLLGQGASDAQQSAANSATQLQQQMYGQQRSDQMPWLSMGTGAINELGYLMGITPQTPYTYPAFAPPNAPSAASGGSTAPPATHGNGRGAPPPTTTPPATGTVTPASGAGGFNPSTALGGFGSLAQPFGNSQFALTQDPGYQFRLQQGQQALERSQAARGGLLSGAAAKSMDTYSQGMASQEYQNAFDRYNTNQTNLFNRLGSLAGVGQTANQQLGTAGQNAANNMGNFITQGANAQSAGMQNWGNMFQTGLASMNSNSMFSNPWSQNLGLGPAGSFSSGGINWGPLQGY